MNILHLIDTTGPGGAETIFTELANHSSKLGHTSIAVIRGDGWVQRRLAELGIETVVADCKGSFNTHFLRTLRALLKQRKIDLIHAHLLGSNVYASLAGLLTGTPVIATFHGSIDIAKHERFAWAKMRLVKTGAHVVTVSEDLRSEVATHLGEATDQVFLIPNAIDCQRFAEVRRASPRSTQAGDAPIVGCLGNIRPAKAYDIALRALALVRGKGRDVKLRIAGDPKEPLQGELNKLADELGIRKSVDFVGFIDDPASFLASLDILLLSSSSEGHPLAVTQAMAAALPIVATRCGVEKILRPELGWLATVGDAESVAAALEQALDNPDEAVSRGAAAQREAFEHYDYAVMFARYRDLYASMAARRSGMFGLPPLRQ